jgi:hypothetical protein
MFRVSRRSLATFGLLATILLASPGVVAAAAPDSSTSARASGSATGAAVMLGAMSHLDAGHARPVGQLHGGGLKPPATDVAPGPLAAGAPVSGVGLPLAAWVMVLVVGVLASLRYTARRSRL